MAKKYEWKIQINAKGRIVQKKLINYKGKGNAKKLLEVLDHLQDTIQDLRPDLQG